MREYKATAQICTTEARKTFMGLQMRSAEMRKERRRNKRKRENARVRISHRNCLIYPGNDLQTILTEHRADLREISSRTFSQIHHSLWDLGLNRDKDLLIGRARDSEIPLEVQEYLAKINSLEISSDLSALATCLTLKNSLICQASSEVLTLTNSPRISLRISAPLGPLGIMIFCKE